MHMYDVLLFAAFCLDHILLASSEFIYAENFGSTHLSEKCLIQYLVE